MIVVDPGVGSKRAILGVKTEKAIFLAPDNGVLKMVFHHHDDAEVRLAAVNKIDDQSHLIYVARHDSDVEVRISAVDKLVDERELDDIIKYDDEPDVRLAALLRLREL